MNQIDLNLPIFLHQGLKSYPIDWMKTQVLAAHQTANYTTGNNFQIKDSSGVFYTLYKDFFRIASQHFVHYNYIKEILPTAGDMLQINFFIKAASIIT